MFLRKELSRALPNLDKSFGETVLRDKFPNAMPTQIANQVKLVVLVRQMTLEEMAEWARSLPNEQNQVASLNRSENEVI